MKQKRYFVPALLAAIGSILLVTYSLFFIKHGFEQGNQEERWKEPFKFLGTLSVYAGAINFSWYYFKKKVKSPVEYIKRSGKFLHHIHTYIGFIGLFITTVHGIYFIWNDFQNKNTLTGIAAFLILFTLAVYGWLFKRVRNKKLTRTIHFYLSNIFLLILLIHAGGTFLAAAAITLTLWGMVGFLESRLKSKRLTHKGSDSH